MVDSNRPAETNQDHASATTPPPKRKRVRLDVALVERGLEASRERAQILIRAGEVTVNGEVARAPSTLIAPDAVIAIGKALPYVSRGGVKLAHALDRFEIDVSGRICLDAGASTGGFTDVLLQRGAARVYAVDVGKGQLAWTLRRDPRVVVMEEVNVRRLRLHAPTDASGPTVDAKEARAIGRGGARGSPHQSPTASPRPAGETDGELPERVSFAVADLVFISLRLVLPALVGVMRDEGELVALVKPQFEAGPADVGKGGVIRNPEVHRRVLREILEAARQNDLHPAGLTASPIRGQAGNIEFLLWARRAPHTAFRDTDAIQRALDEARAARA
jgi:23S rRNA (cytidine1920-2'-O)/16S rRNA (cytidine1409-2'-O)-methyltransferase